MNLRFLSTPFRVIQIYFLIITISALELHNEFISILPNNTIVLNCTVGSSFSQDFAGKSLLSGNYVYSFSNASVLPDGLGLTSVGRLSGRCEKEGNYSFGVTMTVSGLVSTVVGATYRLMILPNTNQVILPNAYVGIPYTARMTMNNRQQAGGAWVARGIPSWLNFDSVAQTVTGIPQVQGNFTFAIGYNSAGGYTETSFLLRVVPNLLSIIPKVIEVGVGQPKNISFNSSNGIEPYSFMFLNLPSYLRGDRNVLIYDGNCQLGGSIISMIVLDSKSVANLFNVSVICQNGNNMGIAGSSLNSGNAVSNLRSGLDIVNSQRLLEPSTIVGNNMTNSQPVLYPLLLNQRQFQSDNTNPPKQILQNNMLTSSSAKILPILSPSPPPQQQQFLNSIYSSPQALDTTPTTNPEPPKGIITGGICTPHIMLPQPYSTSGTISIINYNNSTIILKQGPTLKLQPCTRIIYSGISTKLDIGNSILYTAQRNTTSPRPLNQLQPTPINPDILLSVTNLT